jgi:hypothetical protein
MSTKDEKKWKFSACALGSNGVPGDFDPRAHGSKKKITQIPGTPPFLGGFEGFWKKSDLFQNVKKKWFRLLPYF